MQSALTSAMMTAARYAPGTDPMPPTTTTTKASPMTVRSIARFAGSRASCSAPPRPDSNDPAVNTCEQQRLVDAERPNHFSILGGGTHQPAEPGARQRKVQDQEYDRPRGDHEQIIGRETPAEHVHRTAQARCAWAEEILRPPQPQRRIVEDQHHREGRQQPKRLRHDIHA